MERTDVLLSLLSNPSKPIVGTTRLQKLIFLIEKESNVHIDDENFDFKANQFGPASDKLYDDLNFLENLGYLERSGETSSVKQLDIDKIEEYGADTMLSYVNKIVDENDESGREVENDEDDTKIYRITEKGLSYLNSKKINEKDEGKAIQEISKKYGKLSLLNLLKYVYSNYESYTINSIIKDRI